MKKLRRFLATLVVATLFASAFTAYAAAEEAAKAGKF